MVFLPALTVQLAVMTAWAPTAAFSLARRLAALTFVSSWPPTATPRATRVALADPEVAVTAQVAPGTVASRTVGILVAEAPNGRTVSAVDFAGDTKRGAPDFFDVDNDRASPAAARTDIDRADTRVWLEGTGFTHDEKPSGGTAPSSPGTHGGMDGS